jgi:hypothetical protein
MIDNIPYRMATDVDGNKFLLEENYTWDAEFIITTLPSYQGFSDDPYHGKYVTTVNAHHPIMGHILDVLEARFSETEEDAVKTHREMLDKWNEIGYTAE